MTLAELNAMSAPDAGRAFRECCGSSRWVESMLLRRPFDSPDELYAAADQEWDNCGPADWHEAFSYHPRIGAVVSGNEAREQAGAQSAPKSIKAELDRVNRAYEERFGHIYIVCASGKTAEEMLSIATARLANDAETELRIAAEEQRKIMQLRLRKLLS